MCYNCGCKLPYEDHGKGHAGLDPNGKAITAKSFAAVGIAFDMTPGQSKQNAYDLLSQEQVSVMDTKDILGRNQEIS